MKSERGHNPNKYILKNININYINKINLQEKEYLQTTRRNNSRLGKLISSSANTFGRTRQIIKQETTQKTLQKKDNPNILKILKDNLNKHNSTRDKYFTKIINDIIYDEKKHSVCIFKDYLLWDESAEFLKRYYLFYELTERIPKISAYYEKYTVIKPIYFKLTCNRIMSKHIKRQKKYLEWLEENEDKHGEPAEKNDNTQYSQLLRSSLIKDATTKNDDNNVKNSVNLEENEKEEIKRKINFEEDAAEEEMKSIQLNNSVSCITNIIPNETHNFSFLENLDKIIGAEDIATQLNKNKDLLKIQDLILTAKQKITTNKEIYINSPGKKKSISPKNVKNIRISPNKMNMLKSLTAKNDDKQTKTVKKIEIKKLNLENINKLAAESQSIFSSNTSRTKLNTVRKQDITKQQEKLFKINLTERIKHPNNLFNNLYSSRIPQAHIPLLESNILSKRTPNEIASKFNIIKRMLKQININKEQPINKVSKIKLNTKESNEKKSLNANKNQKDKKYIPINKINNTDNINNNLNHNMNVPLLNNYHTIGKSENIFSSKINQTSKSNPKMKMPVKELRDKSKKSVNSLIKTGTNLAKNILKDNTSNIVNKYLTNNYCHLKAISQTNLSKADKKNKLYKNPSSIYNINLNLNLNLNVKMEKKNSSSNTENVSKINNAECTERQNFPLTDRQSINYNHTITNLNSKIDKMLESSEQFKSSSLSKANEKQQKISRNIDVKNFILNYESGNNPNLSNNGNLLFKKSNPLMISNKGNNIPLISNQNSYSNRVPNMRDLLIKNNSSNNSLSSNGKKILNFNSNRISKDYRNDSNIKNLAKADSTINFKSGSKIVNQKNKIHPLFDNNHKSNAYNKINENIGNFSRQALTSRNEKEKGLIKIFKKI